MPERPRSVASTPVRLLVIAAWIGLGYGIIEGLESFLLSLLPQGLSWQNGNSVDALMYMPVFYLVAYLGLGLLLLPLALLVRRDWWDSLLVFGLVSLSAYLFAWNQGSVFSGWASAILGLGLGSVALRIYRRNLPQWRARVVRSLPALMVIGALVVGGTYLVKRIVEGRRLAALPAIAADRPNILLLVLDTERADHLSAYGYHRPTTPHLDSLAATGILFEQAFSSSSWTLPSHASLFTGLMVHQHQAGAGGKRVLDSNHLTLAERLTRDGYATGGFVANTFWAARHTGLARGFLHYEDFYGTLGDALQRMTLIRAFPQVWELVGVADIPGRKRGADINRDFLQWVDRLDGRPFFAFLNYIDVHAPYLPPSSHEGRFGPRRPEFRPNRLEIGNQENTLPPPEQLIYRVDRYDESLRYLDERIGLMLGELDRRGVLDNTAVIVTSDHGEHFGEHRLIEHGKSLYVQEIRVPLLIRPPGGMAGVRVAQPVSAVRIAATVGDLAGLSDAPFPGQSLLADQGGTAAAVLSEMGSTGGGTAPAGKGWLKSLVSGRWHLILRQSGLVELYDLQTDSTDSIDLAKTPQGAAVVARLRSELENLAGLRPVANDRDLVGVIE